MHVRRVRITWLRPSTGDHRKPLRCNGIGLGRNLYRAIPWRPFRAQHVAVILIVIKFGRRQGCSLRRVGRHWRVRWSCWRGRRRLLGRVSWSRRRVWDCHARPKSRRQAGVRTERRDGSKDQGCCRRGGKCFVHFSTFRTRPTAKLPRQVKRYAHSRVVIRVLQPRRISQEFPHFH